MELIDKSALIAEIEKLQKVYSTLSTRNNYEEGLKEGRLIGYKDALSKINTLETKEVNLEEATINYLLHKHTSTLNEVFHQADIKAEMQYHKDIENAFKMGFELGIKAQKGE